MPAAEVDVSPDLVRRLVAAQHPDLAHLPVEVMTNGWDNVMCRVGGELVARMPRREMGARLIVHEQRWLPVLQPRLPLPVPAPVRTGRPGLGYPWPWSLVAFIPGQVAARTPPTGPRDAAVCMGRFLAALHTTAAPDAPPHTTRGVPLASRAEAVAENLGLLGGRVDHAAVMRAWEAAVAAPMWDGPPMWLHGDLHPANILVHRGRISGVIDFGDITSGDPAADLSIAWMLLPAEYHDVFQNAYRAAATYPAGGACWARAKGWALVVGLVCLGHSADNPLIAGIGRRTVAAVLA
jgi:aminoglycoside phosphotransferase (APT) family kinase protein